MLKKFTPFTSLKNRDYALFLFGFFVSQIGTQMQVVAVNYQLYEITHSAVSLGIVALAVFIPIVLFSLIGGITADKFNRKYVLAVSQVAMAGVAALLYFTTASGSITPYLIYGLLGLHGIAQAFFSPVRQSIIPSLVPRDHLMNAVSLNTLTRQSAIVIGPAIGGFMIAFFGVQSIYMFNAVAFIIMLITILPLKIPAHDENKTPGFDLKSVMEGIKFVRKSSIISSTILLDFFATFFASATTLLPIFAKDILGVDAKGLGLLYAASSVGGVLAGLVMSSLKHIKHQGEVIIGSVLIYGVATIAFGLSKSFYLTFICLAIIGAADMTSTILRNTIRQALTPDHLRGRMVGINILFAQGGPKLGDAEAGFLAAALGAPGSVVLGGLGALVATIIIALKIPGIRKYRGDNLKV